MDHSQKKNGKKNLVSRRDFLIGSGAVFAGIALSACTPKTTSSIPTDNTTTPNSSLTPRNGGVFRFIREPPFSANIGWPAEALGFPSGDTQLCFETLLRGDNKGNIYPWLAESYTVADDLKSITFSLKKGVKFHDNSDFNAQVVKWNLENYIEANSGWSSIDIIDDYTIRVNLNKWMNTIPASFGDTDNAAFMISKAAFDKNGKEWMRSNPVGTGPFKYESFQQDVSFKAVKNPYYWVKGKPYLDEFDFDFILDNSTVEMAMKAGVGDAVVLTSYKQAAAWSALGLTLKIVPVITELLLPDTANTDSPWANQKVREAVEYAIDKEAIAKAFGYGYGQPAYQIPPSSTLAYDPNFALGRKFNPEKAKQLLVEAGYTDGFSTAIISFPNANRDIVLVIQNDLAKVGIKAELDFPDMGRWFSYLGSTGTWHNGALYMNFVTQDVSYIGGLQFNFSSLGQSWLKTPELVQAYDAALSARTPDIKLTRAVTDLMTKECLVIPIDEGAGGRAWSPHVVFSKSERGSSIFYNCEEIWLNK